MARMPKFRRYADGKLVLGYTKEAREAMNKTEKPTGYSQPPEEVRKQALKAVEKRCGDVSNNMDVQGEYLLQFGTYRGQTFRWLLENGLGYVGWLIDSIRGETTTTAAISHNKAAFKRYAESFEEVREVVAIKKAEREAKQLGKQKASPKTAVTSLAASLASGRISKDLYLAKILKRPVTQFRPNIPPSVRKRPSSTATCSQSQASSADDDELCALVDQIEKDLLGKPVEKSSPKPSSQQVPSKIQKVSETIPTCTPEDEPSTAKNIYQEYPLPEGWRKSLPKADHHWVSQALFKGNAKTGKAELDFARVNKLWWHPPQAPLITTQPPRPNKFFAQRLLLWMPRKLWRVKLHCPHSNCNRQELTGAGIYPKSKDLKPRFMRFSNGELRFNYSEEARQFKRSNENNTSVVASCKAPSDIKANALSQVKRLGGDIKDEAVILGQYTVGFGIFKGKTFKWLVENGLGYAAWLVDNMGSESETLAPLSQNKHAFKRYLTSFPEGKAVVKKKQSERLAKSSTKNVGKLSTASSTISHLSPTAVGAKVKNILSTGSKYKPTLPSFRSGFSRQQPIIHAEQDVPEDLPDDILLSTVMEIEETIEETTVSDNLIAEEAISLNLPDGWKQSLPKVDHEWVSKALFKVSKKGTPAMDFGKIKQLWWYPPQPLPNNNQPPRVNKYFAQRLLLTMPKKVWNFKLVCPNEECSKHELTSSLNIFLC